MSQISGDKRSTRPQYPPATKLQSDHSNLPNTRSRTKAQDPPRVVPSTPPTLPGLGIWLGTPSLKQVEHADKKETRATSKASAQSAARSGVKRKSPDGEEGYSLEHSEPMAKKPKVSSRKVFRFFDLPPELRGHILSFLAAEQGAEFAREFGYDPAQAHVSVVKQVVRSDDYADEGLEVVKHAPYASDERFLKENEHTSIVQEYIRHEQYGAIRRAAFNTPGSILRTKVTDLNFGFLTAFLKSLNERHTNKILSGKVTMVIALEPCFIEFPIKDVCNFTKLLSSKFPASAEELQAATNADPDDPEAPTEAMSMTSNISFEFVPGLTFMGKEYFKAVRELADEYPDEISLLMPTFNEWAKKNPSRAG